MVITRALQEWACLFAGDLPFATAQRLLGWLTAEPEILSTSEVRLLVQRHGEVVRTAEEREVNALTAQADLTGLCPQLVEGEAPRRPAAWSPALQAAVETALAAEQWEPPAGVTRADWERVRTARQVEAADPRLPAGDLAHLGPTLARGQIVAAVDEVLVRQPTARQWWDFRTARVTTARGYRYVSGSGEFFLKYLLVLLRLCAEPGGWATVLSDGAHWIRLWWEAHRRECGRLDWILDWYHLKAKCRQRISELGSRRPERAALLGAVVGHLWQGSVDAALAALEAHRPQARNVQALDELQSYLQKRRPALVSYRERRKYRRYIGSAHAEKANDLLVARRQKRRGMHWSQGTSDGLLALRTLLLNREWDRYWQHGIVSLLACPNASAR